MVVWVESPEATIRGTSTRAKLHYRMALFAPLGHKDMLPLIAADLGDRARDAHFEWLRERVPQRLNRRQALGGPRLRGARHKLTQILARLTPADRGRRPPVHRLATDRLVPSVDRARRFWLRVPARSGST